VRLRRIPASAIPETGRDVWLFDEWLEVERWVALRAECFT